MGRKPTGRTPHRPEKEIDWEEFEKLCALQCTQSEIASFLNVHIDTIRDRSAKHYGMPYSSVYTKYSEVGKCSLRRNQFVMSKTNPATAIWLGKQWLGQKDNHEIAVSPETCKQFDNVMQQLAEAQAARKKNE